LPRVAANRIERVRSRRRRETHTGKLQVRPALGRLIRRAVPSTAVISRQRFVAPLLDLSDQLVAGPFPEFRDLPPNRFRVRVGVRNRILFN
jgi:hypothetical protein